MSASSPSLSGIRRAIQRNAFNKQAEKSTCSKRGNDARNGTKWDTNPASSWIGNSNSMMRMFGKRSEEARFICLTVPILSSWTWMRGGTSSLRRLLASKTLKMSFTGRNDRIFGKTCFGSTTSREALDMMPSNQSVKRSEWCRFKTRQRENDDSE